jgi:prepilin-type N-terminal cleavage/methylation domain-containing protein
MKQGYTLVELLIVIVIIGILFSVGYVNFQDYSRQQTLLAAVRSVVVDLHTAQEFAISGNKPTTCVTLLDGYKFNVTSGTTYELDAYCTPNSNISVKQVTVPSGITISNPNPNPILFKALAQGTNIASGATASIVITQTLTGKTRTITIGPNGNVQ